MSRARTNLLSAVAILLFGLFMLGWRWLLTGVNTDFGEGVAVGATIIAGLLGLISRRLREMT